MGDKKKIAFFIYDLRCGGIEKSLIDLPNKIDYDKYDVDLIVFFEQGQFFNVIPPQVRVLHYNLEYFVSMHIDGNIKNSLKKLLENWKLIEFVRCACLFSVERVFFNKQRWEFVSNRFIKKAKPLPDYYDLAIDYQGLGSSILGLPMVAKKIKSAKKLTWIHQDVNYISKESKKLSPYIKEFDKVFCVSMAAKNSFIAEYPEYANRADVFYNIVDNEKIELMAKEPIDLKIENDRLKILSVGRLDYQKGYDIALRSLAKIKDKVPKFVYVIVGGGNTILNELQTLTNELGLEDSVIFAGRQDNPYPYYRIADMYIQPSRFEGFCITLAEAKVFNLPIVTTDFAGAREQIVNMKTGIITECSEDRISDSLYKLMTHKELQKEFTLNLTQANQLKIDLRTLYDCFDN